MCCPFDIPSCPKICFSLEILWSPMKRCFYQWKRIVPQETDGNVWFQFHPMHFHELFWKMVFLHGFRDKFHRFSSTHQLIHDNDQVLQIFHIWSSSYWKISWSSTISYVSHQFSFLFWHHAYTAIVHLRLSRLLINEFF